jgi:D-alanyl-D-alanine carboxypeptidase/D-alanyl-D-alanine-endopeptidase (penicillin-binding protein 4)
MGRVPRHSAARLIILLCGLLLAGAGACARAAASVGTPELQADLTRQLTLAGPHDGAYVYDLTEKTPLLSVRAATMRPPASVEKLYTATAALDLLGPSATLSTTVLGAGQLAPGGVWEGSIYLRGGGDPTFGSSAFIRSHYAGLGTSVSKLAAQLVNVAGIHEISGSVVGDESYLDSRRGEPSSGYRPDPFLEGSLSGLAFDRGSSGSQTGAHAPAAYAARALANALKAKGVIIDGGFAAGPTPAGTIQLAAVQSPTIAQLLGLMLPQSDNFFAETLIKDLGARFGGAGTTAAGAAVVSRAIASLLGIHPRIIDGSGLSESDRTSPYQIADLLSAIAPTSIGPVLRGDMAVAGRTGTLALRMRHTAAAGRCQGKTGTLTGVSNLAGYCQAANGHTLAFAIFTDGIATTTAHLFQDHMAITIAGY